MLCKRPTQNQLVAIELKAATQPDDRSTGQIQRYLDDLARHAERRGYDAHQVVISGQPDTSVRELVERHAQSRGLTVEFLLPGANQTPSTPLRASATAHLFPGIRRMRLRFKGALPKSTRAALNDPLLIAQSTTTPPVPWRRPPRPSPKPPGSRSDQPRHRGRSHQTNDCPGDTSPT